MTIPGFRGEVALYRTSRTYVSSSWFGRGPFRGDVQLAYKVCNDYCEPCQAGGFQTCHEYGATCAHQTLSKVPCAYCGTCAATLSGFLQTCVKGGKSLGTRPCQLCTDSFVSPPWPAPDFCVRICSGPALGQFSIASIDCAGVPH